MPRGRSVPATLLMVRERLVTMFTSLASKCALASVPFAATVVAAVTLTGPPARATMTEQIDAPDAALTGFTGPYATVSIGRVANNRADIALISLSDVNGQRFSKSDSTAAVLSVNGAFALGAAAAADVSLSGLSASFSGVNSLGTLDEFGNVSLSLDSWYPDATNLVRFLITNTTGLWTSDTAVLMNNAGGYSAAIRAFACTPPCARPAGALPTGAVGK